jgi:hypothetical protein
LKEVFALYSLNFEDKNNAQFDTLKGAYFREFKKAYYALMLTDKQWCDEALELEVGHL